MMDYILYKLFYPLLGICSVVLTYCLLAFLAKRQASKDLQPEWDKLATRQQAFDITMKLNNDQFAKQKLEFEQYRKTELAHLKAFRADVLEDYETAETRLQEANNIKFEAHEKIVVMENRVNLLRSRLFNARERAKRLAKQSKTS